MALIPLQTRAATERRNKSDVRTLRRRNPSDRRRRGSVRSGCVATAGESLGAPDRRGQAGLAAVGLAEVDTAREGLPALLDLGARDEGRRDGVVGAEIGAAGEQAAQVGGRRRLG